MLYSSKYINSESYTSGAYNYGSLEYLIDYARRLLTSGAAGSVEIRDADEVLRANIYTSDDGEIIEWINV